MRISLRNRILVYFVLVILGLAVAGTVLGVFFINRTTVAEEQRRVGVDLRSAWSVIQGRFNELSILVDVLGTGKRVAGAYAGTETLSNRAALEAVRRQFGLDFLTLTDQYGRVILRTREPYPSGDDLSNDPIVRAALAGETQAGFQVFSSRRLEAEGDDLEERAFMVFQPTPRAKSRAKSSESSGLVLMAAAPVRDLTGRVMGVIYAGLLLNRNNALVDHIRSIVFEGQVLNGRPVGTVTIFQWDVRVATNVILPNGNRALGTRVSSEVYDQVLENDRSWYSRAFVVNDWYISAYDPIKDVEGKVVGILYVGVLAEKYDQIKRNLWKIYGGVSLVGALLVVLLGLIFARRLTRSVTRLAEGTRRLAEGEMSLRVKEPQADDELRDLTRAFNSMANSIYDREERLKAARESLERTNSALERLNRNYLDMLSFVSHELKNTLGVIFTSARTLAAGLAGSLTDRQNVLVQAIVRNIDNAVVMTRKYLDLARIEKGELELSPEPLDFVADVASPVLEELKEAAAHRRMLITRDFPSAAPLTGDPNLLRVVYKNLLDNALKYGREGGLIRLRLDKVDGRYRFEVWNEGPGLSPEKLERLFGKFVRYKTGQESDRTSTGLGLFITREIILRHGGEIRAESEEGRWVNFIFTLPAGGGPARD
ncbi:MAG: cache domain-containing protein [Thermodesulfobacteriota bacterium]